MFLYIVTGQSKEFWSIYFRNYMLVYKLWLLKIRRGLRLRKFFKQEYGYLVGWFLVLSHYKIENLRVPFRYYKTIEGFILRNMITLSLIAITSLTIIYKFNEIKFWFVNICPDPTEVIYPDSYYPYAIFLASSMILLLQLMLVLSSRTIKSLLSKYRYELLVLNLINVFVLITVHCTVAHEGLLYVWWLPESYEMISFTNEEELVMSYWIGELKYYWNNLLSNPYWLELKLRLEWAYIIMYKALEL